MENFKTMKLSEFDNYVSLDLIPELIVEYKWIDTLILYDTHIRFAKTCKKCGDLILVGPEYNLCSELTKVDMDSKIRYFEILTDLEIITHNQLIECECFDDEFDYEDEDEPEEDEDCYDNYLDPDDDYGDGNYEY